MNQHAFTLIELLTLDPNGHFRHAQRANVTFADGHVALEAMVPGSQDKKLPGQFVGQLRPEILSVPRTWFCARTADHFGKSRTDESKITWRFNTGCAVEKPKVSKGRPISSASFSRPCGTHSFAQATRR